MKYFIIPLFILSYCLSMALPGSLYQNNCSGINEMVKDTAIKKPVRQKAYIKKVYEKNNKKFVEIDIVEWLTGQEAIDATRKDGDQECCPNGYYIRNSSPKIKTYCLANDAPLYFISYSNPSTFERADFAKFRDVFDKKIPDLVQKLNAPFAIDILKNTIIQINECYVP